MAVTIDAESGEILTTSTNAPLEANNVSEP